MIFILWKDGSYFRGNLEDALDTLNAIPVKPADVALIIEGQELTLRVEKRNIVVDLLRIGE